MAALPSSVRRVAVIDIGTNSILVTIIEHPNQGPCRILLDRATITRLGQDVDGTGRLGAASIARSLDCLREYSGLLETYSVKQLAVVGTSALRDASNATTFLDAAETTLGVRPRVIAGLEEARLTCLGAIDGLDVEGPFVMFDVGGGSTEFVQARCAEGKIVVEQSLSLDIGCVRLTERFLRHDPPSREEVSALSCAIDTALEAAAITPQPVPVVAVAGTVTTLASMYLGLEKYDPERIHGSRLSLAAIAEMRETTLRLDAAARRHLTGLDPRRADIIAAGAVLVERILCRLGAQSLRVSDRGLRFGLLAELCQPD